MFMNLKEQPIVQEALAQQINAWSQPNAKATFRTMAQFLCCGPSEINQVLECPTSDLAAWQINRPSNLVAAIATQRLQRD